MEHATRPATIGLTLSSSPLALLAWIGEKYLEWSDEDPALDTILGIASLYWFTSSLPRCIWPYKGLFSRGSDPWPISKTKPLGYSAFQDLSMLPKAWNKAFPNMKFRRDHDKVSRPPGTTRPGLFYLRRCSHVCLRTGRSFCGFGAA